MSRIYVGNLAYDTSVEDVRKAFTEFFAVRSVTIVLDRHTGRSRGFGFVDVAADADEVVAAMHGELLHGRRLNVSLARDNPRFADTAAEGSLDDDAADTSVPT